MIDEAAHERKHNGEAVCLGRSVRLAHQILRVRNTVYARQDVHVVCIDVRAHQTIPLRIVLPGLGGQVQNDRVAHFERLDDGLVALVDHHLERVVALATAGLVRAPVANGDGTRAHVVDKVELGAAVVHARDVPALGVGRGPLEQAALAGDHRILVVAKVLGRVDDVDLEVAHAHTAKAGHEGAREGRVARQVVERVRRVYEAKARKFTQDLSI